MIWEFRQSLPRPLWLPRNTRILINTLLAADKELSDRLVLLLRVHIGEIMCACYKDTLLSLLSVSLSGTFGISRFESGFRHGSPCTKLSFAPNGKMHEKPRILSRDPTPCNMARKASFAWKTENAFALCSAYLAKDFRREEVETKSNSLPARLRNNQGLGNCPKVAIALIALPLLLYGRISHTPNSTSCNLAFNLFVIEHGCNKAKPCSEFHAVPPDSLALLVRQESC